MPIPVIICDDSSFARKQIERALPEGWDVTITHAGNGQEAVEAIQAGKGDILFLDLTMPVMDGFSVLEFIRRHDLPTLAIVVSGDIQAESQARVMSLGAVAFIKKPVEAAELSKILDDYGVLDVLTGEQKVIVEEGVDFFDWCQELANVAMGRAADLLASVIDETVHISIPKVNLLEASELNMALTGSSRSDGLNMVGQGFIGSGISGETLLLFDQADSTTLASLLHYSGELNEATEMELVMDIANILVGAFLKGIAEQLDITLSHGQPIIHLHRTMNLSLPPEDLRSARKILTIELSYTIGEHNAQCDQLILFTEDSLPALEQRIQLLADLA